MHGGLAAALVVAVPLVRSVEPGGSPTADVKSLSVKAFGAIGDGVADDTKALQAALDAGTAVYLPDGRYRVTKTLDAASNQHVTGESHSAEILYDLRLGQTRDILRVSGKKNVVIEHLSVRGSHADGTPGNAALAVRGPSDNVTVQDVVIEGHNSGLTFEYPCSRCRFDRGVIFGQARHNVRQIGGSHSVVENSHLYGARLESVAFNVPSAREMEDCSIRGNVIEDGSEGRAAIIVVQTTNAKYRDVAIEGNTITTANGNGIDGNGVALDRPRILRNMISAGRIGVDLYLSTFGVVAGNAIHHMSEAGVALHGVSALEIADNDIHDVDLESKTSAKGAIYLASFKGAETSCNRIVRNHLGDVGTKPSTQFGVNGSGPMQPANDYARDNDFRSVARAIVHSGGSATASEERDCPAPSK